MKKIVNRSIKGFTLLELLVVISIIGILLAIGAVAFTTAQKKGRDARRRADIKSMQSAFEQYYSQNSGYATCDTMKSFMSGGVLPIPPKTDESYSCTYDAVEDEYCACATLEEDTTGNSSDTTCTAFAAGEAYFCVKNLQ